MSDWKKRNITDEKRVDEFIELYESLGYEVKVENYKSQNNDDCNECMKEIPENFKVIYTRPGKINDEDVF